MEDHAVEGRIEFLTDGGGRPRVWWTRTSTVLSWWTRTSTVLSLILSLLLVLVQSAGAQLIPFGLEKEFVTTLAVEKRDRDGGAAWPLVVAGTMSGGVHANDAFGNMTTWRQIGSLSARITALGLQHWGAGPMDGLHIFAAPARTMPSDTLPLLYRAGIRIVPPDDTLWIAADSGMDRRAIYELNAVDASYYSGHTQPQPVLAGGSHGLWRGTPGGMFWESVAATDPYGDIRAFDLAPHWFGSLVWAAGSSMLSPAAFRSTDLGATWERRLLVQLPIEGTAVDVAINQRTPDSVYVVAAGSVFLTPDGGKSWDTVWTPRAQIAIRTIVLDPLMPEHVYIGGEYVGVNVLALLASSDGGATWRDAYMPGGMYIAGAVDLAFLDTESREDPVRSLRTVVIATGGTGVWMLPAGTPTDVRDRPAQPAVPVLGCAPHPVRGEAVFTLTASEASPVGSGAHLRITDVLGRTVAERILTDGAVRSIPMNLAALPAGLYIATLRTTRITLARTIVVAR